MLSNLTILYDYKLFMDLQSQIFSSLEVKNKLKNVETLFTLTCQIFANYFNYS